MPGDNLVNRHNLSLAGHAANEYESWVQSVIVVDGDSGCVSLMQTKQTERTEQTEQKQSYETCLVCLVRLVLVTGKHIRTSTMQGTWMPVNKTPITRYQLLMQQS